MSDRNTGKGRSRPRPDPRVTAAPKSPRGADTRSIPSISTLSTDPSSFPSPRVGTAVRPSRRAIKVVLIGDGGSGKTSLRNHFLTGRFHPSYRATIGADFITKTMPVDPAQPEGEQATLQIWDTAGQERFQSLGSAFYRGADAVILTMDVSKLESMTTTADETQEGTTTGSLTSLESWYRAFMEKAPGPSNDVDRRRFCWVCAANKVDLVRDDVDQGGVERWRIRNVLDRLVAAPPRQPDYGADLGSNSEDAAPTGDKEPVNPAEVLSRPDPTAAGPAPHTTAAPGVAPPPSSSSSKLGWSLSNFIPTTRSSRASARHDPTKRMSIRSIDVFHPPTDDDGDDEDTDEDDDEAVDRPEAAPASTTPSRATTHASSSRLLSLGAPSHGDRPRERVDSTISLNAPSVYHTPRGSTLISASSTTTTFPPASSSEDDGDDAAPARILPHPQASTAASAPPLGTALSSNSTATRRAVPQTVHDLFLQPPPPSSSSQTPRETGSIASTNTAKPIPPVTPPTPHAHAHAHAQDSPPSPLLVHPIVPVPPAAVTTDDEDDPQPQLEQGFTLFYTSARTGHNIHRLFQHIVTRVVANDIHATTTANTNAETPQQQADRQLAEQQLIKRTIRLASGKNPDRRWGCC